MPKKKIVFYQRPPIVRCYIARIESASQSEQPLVTKCVGGEPHQSCLGLSQVIQDFRWPQRKHFGLEGFMMHTDAELIAFFDRHQGTIDSVTLRSMFLHQKDSGSKVHIILVAKLGSTSSAN